ncbi:hypothetical protein H6P81_017900 [Aristolochia fimbriata]|uniref:Uncharacterized protein n=1 Tax=Aristolochia fimbriata TaxID=158543 RepID=A0AAV7E2E2_ARIFI|nr:hypothetical protein H6P81_017900 [Aristolochia fimbriata]
MPCKSRGVEIVEGGAEVKAKSGKGSCLKERSHRSQSAMEVYFCTSSKPLSSFSRPKPSRPKGRAQLADQEPPQSKGAVTMSTPWPWPSSCWHCSRPAAYACVEGSPCHCLHWRRHQGRITSIPAWALWPRQEVDPVLDEHQQPRQLEQSAAMRAETKKGEKE